MCRRVLLTQFWPVRCALGRIYHERRNCGQSAKKAWRGLIAAEMIATNVGLGYMLFVARDFYRTEVIVLGMIVIGVLWLLIDRLLLAPLERATIERWGMVRAA